MMEEEDPSPEVDEGFTVTVCDGAFVQFLEGFSSLQFYQTRFYPDKNENGEKVVTQSRRIMTEIRLSSMATRKLTTNMRDGLEKVTKSEIFHINRKNPKTPKSSEEFEEFMRAVTGFLMANQALPHPDEPRPDISSFSELYHNLPEEGKRAFMRELGKLVLENLQRFEPLVNQYPKEDETTNAER